ncbi:MAG: NAD-dependent epimerase/dehydratase family protein [Halioglobus sp.]|nr:NAD-dependent epimerase/dehydratase family protein [Halioglobus sp.]
MAKVLVTGATGFIGNHVARLCLERGDEVRAMVMPGEDRSPLDGMDVEVVEGNLLDPASLLNAVTGVEQLYHLAAMFAIWTKDPDLHFKVNVDGARAMMEAAMTAGVDKVVFTSSVAAIGIVGGGGWATEKTPFNAWAWASEYILSKFISHQLVKGMVSDGLPVTMVLPGLPFGPGDRAPTPTGTMIVRTLQGKMKHYWDGGVCAVDVRDVAAGHVLAMEKGRIGESYILANRDGNMTNREFLTLIGEIAGIDDVAQREVSGTFMLRVAKLAELWSGLTGRAPMTTFKNTRYVLQHGYVDPGKAIEELGLPQTPIETAVRDSIAWFREHGYV